LLIKELKKSVNVLVTLATARFGIPLKLVADVPLNCKYPR
jgi:hypothetical protein